MLAAISVRDIVLIDRLDIALGSGLTAITGETGAGKSILLDALSLALGARARRDLLRQGAQKGSVAVSFDLTPAHAAWRALRDAELDADDHEPLTLRRVLLADGKSRCFVNDQPVAAALLRRIGETIVEIHGQRDDIAFLDAATHRDMLDDFARHGDLRARVGALHAKWRLACRDHEAEAAQIEADTRELEELRTMCDELFELNPQPDEETCLAGERAALMAAETIRADLEDAAGVLSGEGGLGNKLSRALRGMERARGKLTAASAQAEQSDLATSLGAAVAALDKALIEASEAEGAVNQAVAEAWGDPERLDAVEERLFALRAAARKYRASVAELPGVLENAKSRLATVETSAARLDELAAAALVARSEYDAAATELTKARRAASQALDKRVARELKPLKLEKARFRTLIDTSPDDRGVHGCDRVAFEVSTNPGADFGPMEKIASGGEFARFMLALKSTLAAKSETVMVFDEVDSGVGGAVADAVGERLSRLALGGQVFVVTHSPQVAARADNHWRISKTAKGAIVTRMNRLDEDGRLEEVARMLAGAKVTPEARAAASQLLAARDTAPAGGRRRLATG